MRAPIGGSGTGLDARISAAASAPPVSASRTRHPPPRRARTRTTRPSTVTYVRQPGIWLTTATSSVSDDAQHEISTADRDFSEPFQRPSKTGPDLIGPLWCH